MLMPGGDEVQVGQGLADMRIFSVKTLPVDLRVFAFHQSDDIGHGDQLEGFVGEGHMQAVLEQMP